MTGRNSKAPRVAAGAWRAEQRNEDGQLESVLVPRTVAVSERGENVSVKTDDGRVVQVSRKLAELYPERFSPIKAAPAKTGEEA